MNLQQLSEEERELLENYRASSKTNRGHLRLLAEITARNGKRTEHEHFV